MNVADRCYLLWKRIMRSAKSHAGMLAVIGAYCTARTSIGLIYELYNFLRVYCTPRLLRRIDFSKKYGCWAVVTGATAGIGKAYAEELARHGVNVILIARNKEKLKRVTRAISETYNVTTDYIVADFSKGCEIYPSIKKALSGVEIGILVNNVGVFYDFPEYFCLVPEEKLWDIININVVAATMMMKIVLPGMLERKKGAIVNITSAAAIRPVPLMAQYAASKTYLASLTRALQYEYSSSGIYFQNLTPFFTVTDLISFSRIFHKPSFFVPSAAAFSRQAVATLGISTKTAGCRIHHLQILLQMFLPEWLFFYIVGILNASFRQEALSRIHAQPQKEH